MTHMFRPTRREIVRCASEKFGTEGYESVPLEAIAAELGVTKAALDSLFRAVLQNGIDDGSLRPDLDPRLASLVILGAINWVGIWFRPSGTQKSQDVARDVVGEALRGYLT